MEEKICEYCDSENHELYVVEIYYYDFTATYTMCKKCISELKHEKEDFKILGKKG